MRGDARIYVDFLALNFVKQQKNYGVKESNMLAKDLIKLLNELIKQHKPHKDVMGECEITIDIFSESPKHPGLFEYQGILTPEDIKITYTSDGVYPVLTAFAESYPPIHTCSLLIKGD